MAARKELPLVVVRGELGDAVPLEVERLARVHLHGRPDADAGAARPAAVLQPPGDAAAQLDLVHEGERAAALRHAQRPAAGAGANGPGVDRVPRQGQGHPQLDPLPEQLDRVADRHQQGAASLHRRG